MSLKRLEKQLASKGNCSTFCNLVARILSENCLRGLRVTKIMNETKLKRVWIVLAANNYSRDNHSQNIRQTQVFM